jgi:hypothetical protein
LSSGEGNIIRYALIVFSDISRQLLRLSWCDYDLTSGITIGGRSNCIQPNRNRIGFSGAILQTGYSIHSVLLLSRQKIDWHIWRLIEKR